MSFSKLMSMQLYACDPYIVDVEVDISVGLNSFSIVGLPDKAVEEAKDRISAAIKNSGFTSPKSKNQKIVMSLAPAELRKEGVHFDLAMALAYLLSVGDINFDPQSKVFVGQLSLDGTVRSIKGVLPYVIKAKKDGINEIYIPYDNKSEAAFIGDINIFPVKHLKELINHFDKKSQHKITPLQHEVFRPGEGKIEVDFNEVKGQSGAKRALEIAAVGRHNIMMYGPPGTGKTMLARAFVSILPKLDFDETLEVTALHSCVGPISEVITHPPFRAPHHGASSTSMIGGGSYPRPGEVTLAHKGVLFMDEFPEFDMRVIDALRQPLEDKKVRISRARSSVVFPSDFVLLGSMNPCPCGFKGSVIKPCICSYAVIQRYQRKISGPIVDRIDMWVEVSEINYEKLGGTQEEESTETISKRVEKARNRQKIGGNGTQRNFLSSKCRELLNFSAKNLNLSVRVYKKIILLARTIADLDDSKEIHEKHILEALQYRSKIFS
jgi:magnesium chelatase family protein